MMLAERWAIMPFCAMCKTREEAMGLRESLLPEGRVERVYIISADSYDSWKSSKRTKEEK